MAGRSVGGDDRRMDPDASTPAYVAATASRLRRAAGELQQWAGSPDAVPGLPVTLAHVEEALDQLSVSLQFMAQAVPAWCCEEGAILDEEALQPEARALRWHLRAVADTLIDARDACPATCEWARRLLGDAATEHLRAAATETSRLGSCVPAGSDLVPRPRRDARKMGARLQGGRAQRPRTGGSAAHGSLPAAIVSRDHPSGARGWGRGRLIATQQRPAAGSSTVSRSPASTPSSSPRRSARFIAQTTSGWRRAAA